MGNRQAIARDQFFRQQLNRQIGLLSEKVGFSLAGISIVISGMASSSIGMDEVPYATLPFPVDGRQASVKQLTGQADFPHDILLIAGVRSQHDVMRGEETQLIGLLALLDNEPVQDTIILFPGTHSKHIYIQNRQLVDFQTFMTGEVFSLMSQHSILNDSVEYPPSAMLSADELDAFKSGVHERSATSVLNSLFRVRTNQLFNKLTKSQNALYLSGLLIGDELRTLINRQNWHLILCSGNTLYELYNVALQELHLSERTTTISADLLDKATIAGQVKLMQNQLIASRQMNSNMLTAFSWELFQKAPVVGIIRGLSFDEVRQILPIYRQAGLTTLEITLNTPDAEAIIQYALQHEHTGLNIGAGTVCTEADLDKALAAGAQFIVTPILNKKVVRTCVKRSIPVFPGAFTPTEIYKAWTLGAAMVKVYPATSLGPGYINDLKAPMNQLKVLPTGGISLSNMAAYFKVGANGVGIGSQLFDKTLIQEKNWSGLKRHFDEFAQHVKLVNDLL